ncbi:MAG: helicase [Bellilinea sp.]|nr:MAG: helicase [Bellilinea sp.]
MSSSIKPGDVVESSRWPEPVKVDFVEHIGNTHLRIVGAYLRSQTHVDQLIQTGEVSQIQTVRQKERFGASSQDVFLALETRRYRYASLYDPLLAMNISKVDPLPHQIEAVYGYILHQNQVRFLIADDPGAGKTIMAGLVIKEMKLRGMIKRILIVTPGHLKDQWQRELKERFDERFKVIDRQTMRNHFGENVWETEFQVITSLDFARQDDVIQTLSGSHWDLTIVDEAHKMAAYKYGDKTEKTKRYRLGEILSRSSTHVLFLTATPHRGDPENFRLFLDLLQPGAFATVEMLEESIQSRENPLFIRRLKEDLKDFQGKPLFLPRQVKTMSFDLGVNSPQEKELYNDLSRYVNDQYNKALASDKRRNIAFAMVILQRRFASSTYALYRSLERRKKRLEELRKQFDSAYLHRPNVSSFLDTDDLEDLSEEERWQQEALWETLSVAENRAELDAEINTLEQLLKKARKIIDGENELKLKEFRKALLELQEQNPEAKILIFTESRDTLEYLERRLRSWNYSVCTIHGGMPLESRIEAERTFRNEAQIMVATEAAGEGINLQFCHLMINYDIPWNPNRLEQRMGRIHRYGQTREVTIFNLVAMDTREGRVLQKLFEKLEEIRNALGTDKVFDVIEDLFPGRDLAQLLAEAAANARRVEDILQEIEIHVDEEYLRSVRDQLGESLATRYIDYTRIQEMNARARERRLIPEYTQAFFLKAWERLGGEIRSHGGKHRGFFSVDKIPGSLRSLVEGEEFKRRFGTLSKRYAWITFDKTLAQQEAQADFVSFGHPLFEAVLQWVEQNLWNQLQQGATFIDPDGRMNGTILFYEGQITDGMGQIAGKRLFSLFIPQDGDSPQALDPAIIWDLQPADSSIKSDTLEIAPLKDRAMAWLIPQLEAYQQELSKERLRENQIKQKYGVESLRYLILDLDNDLIHLKERALMGEDVALAVFNKEQLRNSYQQALKDLQETLKRELQLTLNTPNFLAAVRVLPLLTLEGSVPQDMENDPGIEQKGMEWALRYEREHGRQPQDVATENLGYDIRSVDPASGSVRYIEVKARAKVGQVALTKNEWFTAHRLGQDYYLYVVMNAASEHADLYVVQNPAACLQPEEHHEVRYLISAESIQRFATPEEE